MYIYIYIKFIINFIYDLINKGIFDGFTPEMRAKVKIEGENPFETQPGFVNAFCLSCVSPLEPNLARKN